ncbi:MAG: ParB/RepB/Spo0J family partition protein [Faecalibacterium sp.]|jgi:ParB family chromosome partitioning protein|nr:ParB/RepB/Spo0J family partition protein [Faecalibacterium sp.]
MKAFLKNLDTEQEDEECRLLFPAWLYPLPFQELLAEKTSARQSDESDVDKEVPALLTMTKPKGKLIYIDPEKVDPSPYQARREFDPDCLAELAESIRENGLLQPITVRRFEGHYQLIAGERRLRACILANMAQLPAILYDPTDEQAAALGLLENIQRRDLDPFEQARGIRDVMSLWACSQADAARRLGISQPTLANKLRLLQLSDGQQTFIVQNGLTERHARAALRLPDALRDQALGYMASHHLTARAADTYVDALLNARPKPRKLPMVKDVRIFVNTINHAIRLMTENGVPASTTKRETEGYIEYTVRIPTTGETAVH